MKLERKELLEYAVIGMTTTLQRIADEYAKALDDNDISRANAAIGYRREVQEQAKDAILELSMLRHSEIRALISEIEG